MAKKQTIKLTENELSHLVNKTVKKILKEYADASINDTQNVSLKSITPQLEQITNKYNNFFNSVVEKTNMLNLVKDYGSDVTYPGMYCEFSDSYDNGPCIDVTVVMYSHETNVDKLSQALANVYLKLMNEFKALGLIPTDIYEFKPYVDLVYQDSDIFEIFFSTQFYNIDVDAPEIAFYPNRRF
jgi:hypothetical protein